MEDTKKPKLKKTDAEWREELTEIEFQVTRKAATEAPFTGEYADTKTPGTYVCKCCGEPLFSSKTKYESGCGWPSFYAPVDMENIDTKIDRSHFMIRTEALCSNCDAHLGHVFPDGPHPTGQRWCINSASLKLNEDTEE
ncbi:MAG: peptide-methionine (R)-S-oxide reductase MsrB [Gammaproteobacteria bacterium]|nr:peptide-methionine (R)-S-oxide reductase MsrB [Gammaproteobacteria bacterium]